MNNRKRMCYLCLDKPPVSQTSTSVHRFPKNEDIRRLWIQACDLSELTDDVSNLHLCSAHFAPEDYGKYCATGSRLKKNAVPTVNVPGRIHHVWVSVDAPSTSENGPDFIGADYDFIDSLVPDESAMNVSMEMPVSADSNPIELCASEDLPVLLPSELQSRSSEPLSPSDNECTSTSTPEKERRFYQPRYISEITPADVQTSRNANIVISLVKAQALKQAKKIKKLQNQNRRLRNQVSSLRKLVKQLKKEDAG